MQRLLSKILLSFLVLSMFLPLFVQNGFSENTATLYPDHGEVNTRIYLQVRGIGGQLYLYWGDIFLQVYSANVQDFLGFDIYFSPSNVTDYSNDTSYTELGSHNVSIQVFYTYWGGIDVGNIQIEGNTTLSFEITEIAHSAEYMELLAKYNDLLSNYAALNQTYYQLLDKYNALLNDHNNLSIEHETLNGYFENLNSFYYNLQDSYQNLDRSSSHLNTQYNDLQTAFNNLDAKYNGLNQYYAELMMQYKILADDAAVSRGISTFFALATAIFLATTIFFAMIYEIKNRQRPSPSHNTSPNEPTEN